jgi:hypothetical protein
MIRGIPILDAHPCQICNSEPSGRLHKTSLYKEVLLHPALQIPRREAAIPAYRVNQNKAILICACYANLHHTVSRRRNHYEGASELGQDLCGYPRAQARIQERAADKTFGRAGDTDMGITLAHSTRWASVACPSSRTVGIAVNPTTSNSHVAKAHRAHVASTPPFFFYLNIRRQYAIRRYVAPWLKGP